MRKILTLTSALLLALPGGAQAQSSSTELIEGASRMDGRTVEFRGEAIGDLMPRGDHVWLNVSDGQNTLGVWIASDALPPLRHVGRYDARGDVLDFQGVFHRACPEHGGDMDLHAETATIVTPGASTTHDVDWIRLAVAALLLLASLGAWAGWKRRERRLLATNGADRS
ncbi:MAG: DNA-binding protein [Deltaproteobacteria bacterium]|nr:DNA-binding protein [Deltaproteobacteria bacterium]